MTLRYFIINLLTFPNHFTYSTKGAFMKKYLYLALFGIVFAQSSSVAAGGVAPCLATFLLGDTRIGLYMNEGKPVELVDWLGLVGIGRLIGMFEANSAAGLKGCCVAFFWGRRAGTEIKTTKIRSKEVLMCIPVVDIYPCIALPLEAMGGKTMSQVIEEENLKR
jgi:hypothetical protein